jgi:hypothetical protein
LKFSKRDVCGAVGWMVVLLLGSACATGPEEFSAASTDLYLLSLEQVDGVLSLGEPANLTDRDGYDNQPAFVEDGSAILYASGEGSTVEIFRYDLTADTSVQLTHSPEREYSPTPIPGASGFSAVRVEETGKQRLWAFDADGGNPTLLLEWEEDVGYHAWVDQELVVLRIQGETSELRFADVNLGWVEEAVVAKDVGRAVSRVPGQNAISFVQKDDSANWRIKQIDLLTREVIDVVATRPDSEDYAWTPQGTLVMARGSQVFAFDADTDEDWVQIADLASSGVHGITRIAVSPQGDKLVLIAERQTPAGDEPG